jgi:hypothetical protein
MIVHVKELENGRIILFWKRTDHWCTFSWGICDRPATLLGVSRATVSKVVLVYVMQRGKTTTMKRNSGWKSMLTGRDCCTLGKIVSKYHVTTAAQVNSSRTEYSSWNPISTETIRCVLHKSNIHGRAATAKPLITENIAQMCEQGCHYHKNLDIR